jgi:hypothetical protein
MKKLWEDIRLIYEGLNFSKRLMIDDLMIISQDNCYLLHYHPDGKDSIQIRIEKDYNLVRIWGGDVPYDMVNYKIYVQVGDQIYTSENSMIELTYKIINPHLREVKLLQLEINDKNEL